MITCRGRDHIVNVQSGRKNPVIVNVHFEPELTSRRLRERLRLITPTLSASSWVILISVSQKKEDSMCGTKPSPTVTRERPALFHYMSSRLLNLTTLGGTLLSLGSYARCQGLIVPLLTCLWLRRVTFIATPMFLRIWGTGPFRVITRLYVLSFKANAFQVGCPNIPFSALF